MSGAPSQEHQASGRAVGRGHPRGQVVEAPAVRHLPRWPWGVPCVCCNPLGGIAFLVLGWQRRA